MVKIWFLPLPKWQLRFFCIFPNLVDISSGLSLSSKIVENVHFLTLCRDYWNLNECSVYSLRSLARYCPQVSTHNVNWNWPRTSTKTQYFVKLELLSVKTNALQTDRISLDDKRNHPSCLCCSDTNSYMTRTCQVIQIVLQYFHISEQKWFTECFSGFWIYVYFLICGPFIPYFLI